MRINDLRILRHGNWSGYGYAKSADIFNFRVISWPTIPHKKNEVSYSIKVAAFQASGSAEPRTPEPQNLEL